MSRDIALNIAINAGQALSEAEQLRSELEATEAAVEGLSATEVTAQGFSDAATEIEGMRRAAEALGVALGPELTGRVGAEGFASLIAEARTAGATFDEIVADADRLAAGVRDLDAAMGSVDAGGLPGIAPAADTAVGGVRRVGDEAGRSRQAMGSLAGESVQKLGGLLGPLQGVSTELGSIADQALSGGAGFGAMAAQGVALAGVGVGVAGVMKTIAINQQQAAEADAFNTAEAEQFADALGEAGDKVANLAASLREAGEVEFLFGEGGFGQQVLDIQPQLTQLGLTASQTAELIAGGAPGIHEWAASLRDAGVDSEALGLVQIGLAEKAEGYAEAQKNAAEQAKFFALSQGDVTAAVEAFNQQQRPTAEFAEEFFRIGAAIAAGATPALEDMTAVTDGLGISLGDALSIGDEAFAQLTASGQAAVDMFRSLKEDGVAAAGAVTEMFRGLKEDGVDAAGAVTDLFRGVREDGAAAAGAVTEFVVADVAERLETLRDGLAAVNEEWSVAGNRVGALQTALGDLNLASDLDFSEMASNTVQSFDDLKEKLVEVQEIGSQPLVPTTVEELSGLSDEADAVIGSIGGMRTAIQTELAFALQSAGGDFDGFTEKAAFFREEVATQFQQTFENMGLGPQQAKGKVDELLSALGLLPEQVETQIKLTQNEEALQKIDIFGAALEGLPASVQSKVIALAEAGQAVKAWELIKAEIDAKGGVDAPVKAKAEGTVQAGGEIDKVGAKKREARIGTDADTQLAEQKLARTSAARRTAKIGTDADTQLAEQKLARTAAARRVAKIFSDADTQLAEQKLARTAAARRTAKIGTDADTQLAEQKLARTAAAQRTATIDTGADVSKALSIIQGAAGASYNAKITATARDNASGALDAIAGAARFAYITAIVSNIVERS